MRNLIIVFLFFSLQTNAQIEYGSWKVTTVKDEFGDETGKISNVLYVEGSFSNSAVANQPMNVKINHLPDEAVLLGFLLNKRNVLDRFKPSNKGVISIKRADGKVEEYEGETYALGIYFLKDSDFYNLITNGKGENLKVYVRGKNFEKYSNSEYNFSFTTQKTE